MKLSVITINYNNAEGLKKTIESVVSQTWQEFEYIIIDGASTDGSKEIVEQFVNQPINQSTNQPINFISEPDSGIFNAMNKGIKLSKGEYLLFLNSGDFLISETVLFEVFNNTFVEDIICAKCALSNQGNIIYITAPPVEFTFRNFFGTTLAHQSTFIKRNLFEKFGYYREDIKLKSDWEFFVRTIILNKCSTISVNVLLTNYNVHGVSSSVENKEIQLKEMKLIYEETILCKFVPDYLYYSNKLEEMNPFFWVKNKKFLNYTIMILYNIAKKYNNLRNILLKEK